MERREFMKLFGTAALAVAIPGSARDAILARIEQDPKALHKGGAKPAAAGWYRVSDNRVIQWGEVIIGATGAEEITFPLEMYSTLLAKGQGGNNEIVQIRSISPTSMKVFSDPCARVMWIAVGEIHHGRPF